MAERVSDQRLRTIVGALQGFEPSEYCNHGLTKEFARQAAAELEAARAGAFISDVPILNPRLYDVKYEFVPQRPWKVPPRGGPLPDDAEYEPRVEKVVAVHAYSAEEAVAQVEFRMNKGYCPRWREGDPGEPLFGGRPRHLVAELRILDVIPHGTPFIPRPEGA